jgi:lysine biosynthesis protein LysW
MPVSVCPECRALVTLEAAPALGQRAECPGCRAALEVVSLQPLELDWRFEEPLTRTSQLEESAA